MAALHRTFPWPQKLTQLLAVDSGLRYATETRECPPYRCPSAGTGSRNRPEVLIELIPAWPADRSPATQAYVAAKLRAHVADEFRCVVYASAGGPLPWQSVAHRVTDVLDDLRARAMRLQERPPNHALANRALRLSRHWEKRAAQNPGTLWAARSIHTKLLDAPPVDPWHDDYGTMLQTIEGLRTFVRELAAEDRPIVLLLPFTLEPYAVTLLAAPDYPTNLLLANVFPRSPFKEARPRPDRPTAAPRGHVPPVTAPPLPGREPIASRSAERRAPAAAPPAVCLPSPSPRLIEAFFGGAIVAEGAPAQRI